MTTAVISWELPIPSGGQRPIDRVRVALSADGGVNWSTLPDVPAELPTGEPNPQEVTIADIAQGGWQVRLTVVDIDGVSGQPLVHPFEVPGGAVDPVPPGQVLNVTVTFV